MKKSLLIIALLATLLAPSVVAAESHPQCPKPENVVLKIRPNKGKATLSWSAPAPAEGMRAVTKFGVSLTVHYGDGQHRLKDRNMQATRGADHRYRMSIRVPDNATEMTAGVRSKCGGKKSRVAFRGHRFE